MTEFEKLLAEYGSCCEYCGEIGADPDHRPSTLKKYDDRADELYNRLCDMYERAADGEVPATNGN